MAERNPKPAPTAHATEASGADPNRARQLAIIDDAGVTVTYANFCNLAMLNEELALNFGMNMTSQSSQQQTVRVSQRIVVNYYWAKRMLGMLNAAVHQYEETFGPLEVDISKRAKRPPAGQAA